MITTTKSKVSDEDRERVISVACDTIGCLNCAEVGSLFCGTCLHGVPRGLPFDLVHLKVQLDEERLARLVG